MVEELVVHIGTHKTGTTAIQGALSRSRAVLLERGILYPETGRGRFGGAGSMQRFPGHANLARQALGSRAFDPEEGGLDELVAEVDESGASRVLLSAEDFSAPTAPQDAIAWIRRLAEKIEAKHVRVVIFLRPQWEYLESRYAQHIKGGRTHARFPRFVESDIDHPQYDYVSLVARWGELGSTTLVGYGRGITGSAVDDFAERILPEGIHLEVPSERPNQRGGEKMIEMLRVVRGFLATAGLGRDDTQSFFEVRRRLSTELGADPPWRGLTTELAEKIWTHYLPQNTRLVDRLGGESTIGNLIEAPDQLPPPSTWTLADASNHEIDLFTSILKDILRT